MRYLLILFALLVALPAYGQTQIPASKVTGIPAQLEEGGNQEMDVERLPTSCAENQIPKADATGGLVCAADEDSGAGSGGATDTVAGDVGGAATGADITLSGGTGLITTRAVDDIEFTVDGQQHVYLATTQAEAETARDACGVGVGGAGDTTNGCTVRLACGVIPWTTFTISGATTALGRDSLILEGCGAGGSVNAAGGEVGATVLQSSTAAAMIEVGICHGCEIRNLGFDGGDTATVAVDMTDASGGWPSSFFKIRNVDVDRINGFAFRTATVGQWDNLLIEGSSVRGSDGCYQQRDNQNKTIVWSNNECANLSAGATVAFDIQEGTFSHTTSFVGDDTTSLKYFDFGVSTQYEIRDSRFEMDGASQVWIEDGTSATASERLPRVVDGNFVKVEGTGAVCLDVARRGSFTFTNNALVDVNGAPDSNDGCTSDFEIDTAGAAAAGDTLQLTYFGNVQHNLEGAGMYPETWMPTVTGDVMLINPVSSHDTLEDRCTKGEVQVLVDGTSGQQVYVCETTATDGTGWVLQGGGASLPVLDTVSIAEDTADPTKEVRFDVGNNTAGVIGTIATAFTTAGTLFLPDVTADTAVARATTDTLTNKTIDYQTGASAPNYPRLAQSTTPPAADCDAAAEVGRLYMDTDEDTDGAIMLCDTGPAWKAVGGGGAGFLDQTAGVLHPTTSTDDLANDATGTNWRMTNLGALTASSVTLDPADDAAMTLTTATDSADVSIGITGSTGPESIMDLNVDVGGAETKLMEIDGVAETVEMERPLELRNGTSSGELRIWEPSGSGTENVTFIVPPLALDTDYTLPTTDGGVDEFLQTNGAGVLTWAAPAGGGGNAFRTWDTDLGTDPVADIASDTMILTSALAMTVTGADAPDSITLEFDYGNELTATDIVMGVDECLLRADAGGLGGGFVCEGSTADANEQEYFLPDVNGADTQEYVVVTANSTGLVDDFQLANDLDASGDILSGVVGGTELDLSLAHTWTNAGTTTFDGTLHVEDGITTGDKEAEALVTNRLYVLNDNVATGPEGCAGGSAGTLSIVDGDESGTDDYHMCDGTSLILDINDVTSDTELAAWTGSTNLTVLGNDAVNTIGEIDAGIKRGPDATDTHILTTDVAAPGALTCLEMDTDGSVVFAAGACGVAGGEANTLASPDVGAEVDLINSVPKTGTALNLVSLEADDFGVAANIITIDATHTGSAHHTVFAPTAGIATDHGEVAAIGDLAAGMKRGPDATDTHLLTTDVAAPGALTCLEMDTDGSVVLAGGACGAGGGEANTISSQGGATALTAATPKSGVDLRIVSANATRFSVATDVLDIASVAGITGANEDDLTDDLPGVLSNVGAMTTDNYCQANALSGFDCDVASIPAADVGVGYAADIDDFVTGELGVAMTVGTGGSINPTTGGVIVASGVDLVAAGTINIGSGDVTLINLVSDLGTVTDDELTELTDSSETTLHSHAAGGFTSFDVQGDDGAPNAVITNGNVLIVSGGNAITTEDGDAGADTLSIAVTANSIDHDELGTPLTMAATDVLNFDAWEDTDANGFILPTGTTSCANVATAGQACWRESDNTFWVGDGTAPPTQVGAGGSGFFDQTTGVLHPTTATDDIGNDATGTNWLITDAGDATVNTLAAADQESQAATTNEIVVFDDDNTAGDSTCALAGAAGELRIADVQEAGTGGGTEDDWEICEGTTTLLDITGIAGNGITKTAGVLSADLAVVAALAGPTFTGTVTVPQPFTIGAISMTSTATELNLLDGVTDIATQGELDGFVGSSNIVTVGTITTGTWTGTDIAVADGGTGVGTFTSNGILIGDGGNALDVTAELANGQLLIGSTGADPVPAALAETRSLTITPGAGTLSLAADEELYRDEEGFFILDGVLTAGEEVLVKANGALTLVQLDCVALGGSTPSVTYTVVECNTAGGSCGTTNLAVSPIALGTNYPDTDCGATCGIADGNWWGLEATTLTTEPNTVNCTVEFTRND